MINQLLQCKDSPMRKFVPIPASDINTAAMTEDQCTQISALAFQHCLSDHTTYYFSASTRDFGLYHMTEQILDGQQSSETHIQTATRWKSTSGVNVRPGLLFRQI